MNIHWCTISMRTKATRVRKLPRFVEYVPSVGVRCSLLRVASRIDLFNERIRKWKSWRKNVTRMMTVRLTSLLSSVSKIKPFPFSPLFGSCEDSTPARNRRTSDRDPSTKIFLYRHKHWSTRSDSVEFTLHPSTTREEGEGFGFIFTCVCLQCRNGILDGTHPVTYEEAIQFAGLQCQIQMGDYQESKHKAHLLE